jgi:2-C-methyl-D-erythritol 2,4-cyclodiphosphate synthase
MNKVGIGVDFHSLIKGDHLIVGGHRIECEFFSQAHSDGDVLTHSIIDALLGALNLGDIGEHFPNTPEYLNISSIELLKKVVQKMPENTKIINVDTSIVLNTPKISSYKNAIKKSLSKVLGVSTNNISIKGTTTNNLGFVDMSNGWGAQAILTIDDGN